MKHNVIVTSHPTFRDIERAKREKKTVISFQRLPSFPMSVEKNKIWMDGYLAGIGLEDKGWIVVMFVPPHYEIEEYIEVYLSMYKENGPNRIIDKFGNFLRVGGEDDNK